MQTEFPYSWQDHYTFYFPQVELDCECTCNIYNNYCTLNTRSKQNNCDNHQRTNSTCSNLEYRGKGVCSKYYKVCCQAYFSVPDERLKAKFDAYKLQLQDKRYTFQVQLLTRDKNYTIKWTIPHWIKHIIIDENTVLMLNMTKKVDSQFNLSDQWVYYWKESGKFYTDIDINKYDRIDLNKMGWFQRNRQSNKMERIARKMLEKILDLRLDKCNETIPKYTWTLNAINYYRENNLYSISQGTSLSDLFDDHLSVSNSDFFSNKPALILNNRDSSATELTVSNNFNVLKLRKTVNNMAVQINTLSQGKYEIVIVGNNAEIKHLIMFVIDSQTIFPQNFTFPKPENASPNSIICVISLSKRDDNLCISTHKMFSQDNERENEVRNTIFSENSTKCTEKEQTNNSRSEIIIKVGLVEVALILTAVLAIILYKKFRKNQKVNTRSMKYLRVKQSLDESPQISTTGPCLQSQMEEHLKNSTDREMK